MEDRSVGLLILVNADEDMTKNVLPLLLDKRETTFNQCTQKYIRVCDIEADVLCELNNIDPATSLGYPPYSDDALEYVQKTVCKE